jgi:hypothetical protein
MAAKSAGPQLSTMSKAGDDDSATRLFAEELQQIEGAWKYFFDEAIKAGISHDGACSYANLMIVG